MNAKVIITRAAIFSFISFSVLFSPQSALADTDPNCRLMTVTHQPSASEPFITIQVEQGFIQDDRVYEFVFEQGSRKSHQGQMQGKETSLTQQFDVDIAALQENYGRVWVAEYPNGERTYCQKTILLSVSDGSPIVDDGGVEGPFDVCKQAGDNYSICNVCMANKQLWTGAGCIPFGTGTGLVRSLIVLGLGITGTVVVLMTLYGAFMFSTSRGDPKQVDEAKSAITSAIMGAFFIIFSVTILRFIGVTILQLPDFG
jgi:hypothetical protein